MRAAHLLLRGDHVRSALVLARLAAALDRGNATAWSTVATVAYRAGQVAEAIDACRIVAALPGTPVALQFGAAAILYDSNAVDDCLTLLDAVLRAEPKHPHARFLQAVTWLKSGDFERGWRGYETRFANVAAGTPIRMTARRWQGEPLAGKRIIVYSEQGFGDCLQWVRFVPLLQAREAYTILWAYPELARLFLQSRIADEIVTGEARPAADYCICLGSLPFVLGLSLQTIPAPIPYLRAADDGVSAWRARWPDGVRRIGLVWGGGVRSGNRALHAIDRRRSLPPQMLERLGEIEARWVSLQLGDHALVRLHERPRLPIEDPTGELRDFADTAAACAALDLIITVDTSIAHLAGALGRPVWLLSRFDGCWRWLLGRADTPWYPTMRIFRQPRPGDWSAVLSAVATALEAETARPRDIEAHATGNATR